MSSSSPESCSASNDFEENSVGRYGIQPYQFEPRVETVPSVEEARSARNSSGEDEDMEGRAKPTLAKFRLVLGRVEACICCQEIEAVQNKLIEAVTSGEREEQPQCITQHPGFHAVCINRWVLQVAWYQYKQQYKAAYDGQEDKLFRHIAYRQLTRWCWGILGKEVRVVQLCAVMCIRNFYPPPGLEEDFVFEGFHYADE
ncbi:uncharacterized protein [Montipora foliosa]|uniref:uncharacterized protein n=1 Tax=Montipora foliosa TaxID=591990 RepID=UPI0035F170D9